MKCETSLANGKRKILETKRPGMVIIHKSSCGACNSLKPKLLESKEINRLSDYFVVISLADDAAPREEPTFHPDGKYVPRIFFLDVTGQVMKEVTNLNGNPRYKYYYSNERSLVNSMQRVLKSCTDRPRRFGTNLKWETNLEAGLQKIVTRQKPGMIIFHKSWCGACRSLKPKFQASKDIEDLSKGFVLISLADDNHPKDVKYMPDGDYVPRVLFLSPQGALLVDIINVEGSNDYKYFYSDAESIARSMKTVLHKYSGG